MPTSKEPVALAVEGEIRIVSGLGADLEVMRAGEGGHGTGGEVEPAILWECKGSGHEQGDGQRRTESRSLHKLNLRLGRGRVKRVRRPAALRESGQQGAARTDAASIRCLTLRQGGGEVVSSQPEMPNRAK